MLGGGGMETGLLDYNKNQQYVINLYEHKDKIAIFGSGKLGADLLPTLKYYGLFRAFIDNDTVKQSDGYMGERVLKIDEYLQTYPDDYIVIAATRENTLAIRKQLEEKGREIETDFVYMDVFLALHMPILSFYRYGKLFVELSQICVTERCTLKCVNCAHACNRAPKNMEDLSIEMVKKSADYYFKNVDITKEFVLIGGEPFLYKRLDEAIEYIGSRYRDKMIMFSITTNGTVLPSDYIISKIKKYDITVRISDYSSTLPNLKGAYDRLKMKLKDIKTVVLDTEKDKWFDYGFGKVDNGDNPVKLHNIFKTCATPCREIRGSKYYFCVMARSVAENTGTNIGLNEYFEMDREFDKEELLRFGMGIVEKGYLSMCRYCRGADSIKFRIPAAIQDYEGV